MMTFSKETDVTIELLQRKHTLLSMIPGGEAHQGAVAALIAKADPNNLSFRMKNIENMFTNESA